VVLVEVGQFMLIGLHDELRITNIPFCSRIPLVASLAGSVM